MAAEAGTDRVVEDVCDRLLEVVVVPDDPGAEALLEEVSLSLPPLVEALRVDACEPVHCCRHPLLLRLDQQMEVRAHQAPGMQLPFELRRHASEKHPEAVAVEVVPEHEAAGNAPGGDVEDPVFAERGSRDARHDETTVAMPISAR